VTDEMRGAIDSALMSITNSKPGDVLVIRYDQRLASGSAGMFRDNLVRAFHEIAAKNPEAVPKHRIPIVLCPDGIEWELVDGPLCKAVDAFAVALAENGAKGQMLVGLERRQFELLRLELGEKAYPAAGDTLELHGPVGRILVKAYDP